MQPTEAEVRDCLPETIFSPLPSLLLADNWENCTHCLLLADIFCPQLPNFVPNYKETMFVYILKEPVGGAHHEGKQIIW